MYRPQFCLLICLLSSVFALPVNAATYTWTGATNSNWNTNTNWGGTVPGSADTATINSGSSNGPTVSTTVPTITTVNVGTSATGGVMTISGGGILNTTNAYIAATAAAATGTMTVTGDGSLLNATGLIYNGNVGTGTLNILNGGDVVGASNITMGNSAGSTGTILVSGAGSTLTSTATTTGTAMRVGSAGTGYLNIYNGGVVDTSGTGAGAYIGYSSGSTGTAVIDGAGSEWKLGAQSLRVGQSGTGNLTVQNGGKLTSGSIGVGNAVNGVGHVTVTGNNSLIDTGTASFTIGSGTTTTASLDVLLGGRVTTGNLYVANGTSSIGTLNIASGGTITAAQVYFGYSAGSSGTTNISGAGSTLTASGALQVGRAGTGFLNITNGGAYISTATSGVTVGNSAGGAGTITIDGNGSYLDNNNQAFVVGSSGTGTVTLSNGGKITNALRLDIGANSDGIGNVTVTGAGSEWDMANYLRVGVMGSGSMSILNGGVVKVTAPNSSFISAIGYNTSSTGTMTVDGAGSLFTMDTSVGSVFRVGYLGNGTLNVTNGGAVSVYSLTVGNSVNSTSTMTIDGAGSQVTTAGSFSIGFEGNGTINVTNGGVINSSNGALIGSQVGGTGLINVDGTGSQWNAGSRITVGNRSSGTMNITNGGKVYSFNDTTAGSRPLISGIIGNWYGSTGTVLVNGAGSEWVNQGGLLIGGFALTAPGDGSPQYGTGTLTISNGGSVSNTSAYLGANAIGSTGTAIITGSGSSWINSGDIYLGNLGGTGNVQIKNGATVTTGSGVVYNHNDTERTSTSTVYIGWDTGSTGTLTIGGLAGQAAEAAGTLVANTILFGDGSGTLNFNHTDTNYQLASAMIGHATINHYAGVTYLTGDVSQLNGSINLAGGELHMGGSLITNITGSGDLFLDTVDGGMTELTSASGYTGTTTVNSDNTLKLNTAISGDINVLSNGRLQGNGTANNVTLASGATIAPGNSIGTLNVATLTTNSGTNYEVEVNSAGQSDFINVSGTATLNGGTVVAIAYPDYIANTPYTILTAAGGITGAFTGTTDDYLFLTSFLTQDTNNVYLTLTGDTSAMQSAARSPNQRAVVSAIDDPALDSNSAIDALFLSTSNNDLQNNLDQLSGEIHASTEGIFISDQRFLRDAILGSGNHSDDLAFRGTDGKMWLHVFGNWGETDKTSNTAKLNSRTSGFLGGIEKQYGDARYGIGFGASHTNIDQDTLGSEAKADNYHAIAYAGTDLTKNTKLTGGISYTFHEIETSRDINVETFNDTSKADYHAQTAQAFGEISHDFAPNVNDNKARAEVYAQGAYILHKSDSFNEDGEAGLKGDSETTSVATSTLGLRMHREFETDEKRYFTLQGGIAWQHAYGDETPERDARFTGTSADNKFTVQGAPIGRDTALVNLGVGLHVSPNLSYSISYDSALSQDTSEHGVMVHAKWKF